MVDFPFLELVMLGTLCVLSVMFCSPGGSFCILVHDILCFIQKRFAVAISPRSVDMTASLFLGVSH